MIKRAFAPNKEKLIQTEGFQFFIHACDHLPLPTVFWEKDAEIQAVSHDQPSRLQSWLMQFQACGLFVCGQHGAGRGREVKIDFWESERRTMLETTRSCGASWISTMLCYGVDLHSGNRKPISTWNLSSLPLCLCMC